MGKTFRNEVPIASVWQAVCLLWRDWGDATRRTLATFPRDEPSVDIYHFRGPYDSLSGIVHFRVTKEVADELKQSRLVQGVPKWGYTSEFEFLPTDELNRVYHDTIAPRFSARTWGH